MRVEFAEIRGFRSYGLEPQRIDCNSALMVIHSGNSQGKTSLAEGIEWLLTGRTTRRELLGGSPREYDQSLRNVHIALDEKVYVEVGLLADDGRSFRLRRTLTCDYKGASDCDSVLTVDGVQITSPEELGFPLADPPMAAPVLLQHTLRYVLAAKPAERTDYFKALLEVSDLDVVRSTLEEVLSDREKVAKSPVLAKLSVCVRVDLFSDHLAPLRELRTLVELERLLAKAVGAALTAAGATDGDLVGCDLSELVERLRSQLSRRQQRLLPIADLRPLPQGMERVRTDIGERLGAYRDHLQAVDTRTAELVPFLRSALSLPDLAPSQAEAVTCPLCETPDALTPTRIAAVREQVAQQEGLSSTALEARTQLRVLTSSLLDIARSLRARRPAPSLWAEEDRVRWAEASVPLGAPEDWMNDVIRAASRAREVCDVGAAIADETVGSLNELTSRVSELKELDSASVDTVNRSIAVLNRTIDTVGQVLGEYEVAVGDVPSSLREKVERRTETAGWQQLLELAEDPAAVRDVLIRYDQSSATTRKLSLACQHASAAVEAVMDRKLAKMETEIRRWWELLRPDELTSFASLARRGSGKRFFDLISRLKASYSDSTSTKRNAIGVFSDTKENEGFWTAFV